jgi:flavin reductase (DIM6/NTAB) family NADH-FMN oxidoreductase RutF
MHFLSTIFENLAVNNHAPMTIDPKEVSIGKFHNYILNCVAPRPIAFVSTIDGQGNVNLSPFSFFNAFGANPPIMVFAPARRVRDNTTKHSFENVLQCKEVVINMVSYPIVEQMSLASTEYDKGVNEFIKSGLTPVPSVKVKPPRVKESPASFECNVLNVIETGQEGGAGALVICEVVLAHIADEVVDSEGHIDLHKLDLVGRMGGNWYTRARTDVFEVEKPLRTKGIGVDQLPDHIRLSHFLTGNHLGKLGNVESLPTLQEINAYASEPEVSSVLEALDNDPGARQAELNKLAIQLLERGEVSNALKVLMVG